MDSDRENNTSETNDIAEFNYEEGDLADDGNKILVDDEVDGTDDDVYIEDLLKKIKTRGRREGGGQRGQMHTKATSLTSLLVMTCSNES